MNLNYLFLLIPLVIIYRFSAIVYQDLANYRHESEYRIVKRFYLLKDSEYVIQESELVFLHFLTFKTKKKWVDYMVYMNEEDAEQKISELLARKEKPVKEIVLYTEP